MRTTIVRWDNLLRLASAVGALAATASFVGAADPALFLRPFVLGIAGLWLVPISLCVAPLLTSSRDPARAGLALGAAVPALLWSLFERESPVFQMAVGLSVSCLLMKAFAAVRAVDDASAALQLAASATCGALLVAALALCWWWPPVGQMGRVTGRLIVSPFHVVAATFFSMAARHLLARDSRGGILLAAGHLAFVAAPHHGAHGVGCIMMPGPGVIDGSWPAFALGPWWSIVLHRRRVVAAATGS